MPFSNKLLLIILVGTGILLFLLSVIFRRKKKFRLLLITLGGVFGLLPLLSFLAMNLYLFICERPFVGTYTFEDIRNGHVELQLLHDNTFLLTADSCSQGFVQGDWEYVWKLDEPAGLSFVSTSQTVGLAAIGDSSTLHFKNVPICLRLLPAMKFVKVSEETLQELPDEEFSY